MKIYLLRNSDGSGGPSTSIIPEMMQQIEDAFGEHGIHFLLSCVEFIDDTQLRNGNLNGLATSAYNDPNFVTLFLRTNTAGGSADFTGLALAGLGLGVVDDYDIPIHELGHALGLYHTFRGNGEGGPADRVDGSTCCTAGDEVCDTPPDPFVPAAAQADCTWNPPTSPLDPNGDPYTAVLVNNYMSYYTGQNIDCDRRSFTPGQGARMREFLATHVNLTSSLRPGALIHSGEVLLNSFTSFDTDVMVLDGGTLRLRNAVFQFQPGRKLIVRPGGTLNARNSTLTVDKSPIIGCISGNLWKGIELLSGSQPGGTSVDPAVAVIYDCIVEEADNAIFYGDAYRGTLSTTVLGRYYISRSIFRNNRVALNLINPGAQPPVNDIGFDRVILTDFLNNGFLAPNIVAADFVKLANARNVAFTGCTFTQPARPSETPGNLSSTGFGHGIIADRTTVRVESYCPSGFPDDPCMHPDFQPAAFTNCTVGIRLTNSLGSRISGAQITGARRGLMAVGSHSLVVTDNTFSVENNEVGGSSVGFRMCGGLTFSGNTIQHAVPNTNTTGLYIDDSGTVSSTVDNNLFDDCKSGVIVEGQNSVLDLPEAGLQLLCNDMDFSVLPSGGGVKNFTVFPSSTIALLQGSSAMPAGNAFTNYATPAGSDYTNSASLSIEYYYSTLAGLPNQEPINTLGSISAFGSINNPNCTIAFNDFAPDPDPDDVVVHILAEKAKLDLTLAEYEQLGSPTPSQTLKVVEQLNAVHRQLNWSINHLVQDSLHDNSARIATLLDAEGSALAALARQTLSLSRVDSVGYAAERIQVAKTGQWTVSRNLQEYDQWGEQMLEVFAEDRNLFQYSGTELADVVETAESATDDYARGVAGSFLYLYYDSLVMPAIPLGAYTAPVRPDAAIASAEPVLIYPNPAAGRFTVELGKGFFDVDQAGETVTISMRDLAGKVVFATEQTAPRQTFELPRSLASGVYFLSIDNQRTGDRLTRRLMLTQ